jgi:hypothetical protein
MLWNNKNLKTLENNMEYNVQYILAEDTKDKQLKKGYRIIRKKKGIYCKELQEYISKSNLITIGNLNFLLDLDFYREKSRLLDKKEY